MNINYSKLYSSQLDNMKDMKDIKIRLSWGLEEVCDVMKNAWMIIEDLMMLRGRNLEG